VRHKESILAIVARHRSYFPDPLAELEKEMVAKQALWRNYSWLLRYYHAIWQMRVDCWEAEETAERTKPKTPAKVKKTKQCAESHKRWKSSEPRHRQLRQATSKTKRPEQSKSKTKKMPQFFQLLPITSIGNQMFTLNNDGWSDAAKRSNAKLKKEADPLSSQMSEVFKWPTLSKGLFATSITTDGVNARLCKMKICLSKRETERNTTEEATPAPPSSSLSSPSPRPSLGSPPLSSSSSSASSSCASSSSTTPLSSRTSTKRKAANPPPLEPQQKRSKGSGRCSNCRCLGHNITSCRHLSEHQRKSLNRKKKEPATFESATNMPAGIYHSASLQLEKKVQPSYPPITLFLSLHLPLSLYPSSSLSLSISIHIFIYMHTTKRTTEPAHTNRYS
jgi:hypothetical protein